MKKLIISLFVLVVLLGCSVKDDNQDNKNESDNNLIVVDNKDRIWIVDDYQPLDYNSYYKNEREYSTDQDLIRIKAVDEQYSATYGVDIADGLYVQTLKIVESSYNEETNQYIMGSREEIDKQYFVKTKEANNYKRIGVADGYWFYYQKYTGNGDQLVRISYKGEQQVIMDNFDINDCYDISYPDNDVLYVLKQNSYEKDYSIKLYKIYMNGMIMECVDSAIMNIDNIRPHFITQENSYHILYEAENPDYTLKRNYLNDNQNVLQDLLNKYNVKLKESSAANDQYNTWIYNALIYKEYGINITAIFDYDVTTKDLTYSQVVSEVQFPTEQDNIYK